MVAAFAAIGKHMAAKAAPKPLARLGKRIDQSLLQQSNGQLSRLSVPVTCS